MVTLMTHEPLVHRSCPLSTIVTPSPTDQNWSPVFPNSTRSQFPLASPLEQVTGAPLSTEILTETDAQFKSLPWVIVIRTRSSLVPSVTDPVASSPPKAYR